MCLIHTCLSTVQCEDQRSSHTCSFLVAIAQSPSVLLLVSSWRLSLSSLSSSGRSLGGGGCVVGGKQSLQALKPNDAERGAPVGSHGWIEHHMTKGNQSRNLQLTPQPQYKRRNVIFHCHIKIYMIHFTVETVLYIPAIAIFLLNCTLNATIQNSTKYGTIH